MIVAIHQPNYLPWMGYYYKIHRSDVFILLDNVQYSNDSFCNWNLIKTPQGGYRLKIPVKYSFGDSIRDVSTRDELNWREKHLRTIEVNYKKAPHFKEVFDDLEDCFAFSSKSISDVNTSIILRHCSKMKIKTRIIKASDFSVKTNKEQRIIDLIKLVGGSVYYSGQGASSYQNTQDFERQGIQLKYSDYLDKPYRQLWGNYLPALSAIDYFMNCGYEGVFEEKKNECCNCL